MRSTSSKLRFLLILMLTGMALQASADDDRASTYQGFDGAWLRNDQVEAFVSYDPPRVMALRRRGGESPLFVADDFSCVGIRARVHMPDEQPDSSEAAGMQAASAVRNGERAITLTTPPEREKSDLQLTLQVELHATKPLLRITQTYTNLRDAERRLAPWAIIALKPQGHGLLPYGDGFARSLIGFRGVSPSQDAAQLGKTALAVDYAQAPKEIWYKAGSDSDAGWVAYSHGRLLLRSQVLTEADADYPENGARITAFKWRGGGDWIDQPFGEIEHNGPLRLVAANAQFSLTQLLELSERDAPTPTDPDAWRAEIDALPALDWADSED